MNNLPGTSVFASIPYTCGELFQGTLDGRPCLVSCPITIYSTAHIAIGQAGPALPRKARSALESLAFTGNSMPPVALIRRLSSGRGYGTSTADIGAVMFAAARFCGFSLDALEAARLAADIEPTDSTFFPGLALFDHRRAEFHQSLGTAPPAVLVILDPGGNVDSEVFNAGDWNSALTKLSGQHRQAFELLQQGINSQDLCTVAEASTLSAKTHQKILYNPLLERAIALARETGAVGICRAHSGTVVGLLFHKASFDKRAVVPYLRKQLPVRIGLHVTELTGGGPRYSSCETALQAG